MAHIGSVERRERGQRGAHQLRAPRPGEPGRPAHHAAAARQDHQRGGEICHTLRSNERPRAREIAYKPSLTVHLRA